MSQPVLQTAAATSTACAMLRSRRAIFLRGFFGSAMNERHEDLEQRHSHTRRGGLHALGWVFRFPLFPVESRLPRGRATGSSHLANGPRDEALLRRTRGVRRTASKRSLASRPITTSLRSVITCTSSAPVVRGGSSCASTAASDSPSTSITRRSGSGPRALGGPRQIPYEPSA